MQEVQEREELLGRASGDSHVLRIFDDESQAIESARRSSRLLEDSFAIGVAILSKYSEHRDHLKEPLPTSPNVQYGTLKLSKPGMVKLSEISYGPWKENNAPPRRCWEKSSLKMEEKSNGYIFLSLSHSPEFHALQIANAVVVARYLGATLALPDVRGMRSGKKRHFAEFYDINKFTTSLSRVVSVDKNPPARISNEQLPIMRIPNGVSKNFITSNIEPIFRSKRNLKIVTYFNSSSTTTGKQVDKLSIAYRCQAMFEALELQVELRGVVDSMVRTLRSLSQKMHGHFIAINLRIEMFGRKSCQLGVDAGSQRCYDAEETGEFLKRIGFDRDTTIYITQTGWHSDLNPLREIFPNTFTKDAIMGAEEKVRFMGLDDVEYEGLIDYYMCTEGDAFVAAYPSRFYESVVGKRIAYGNTQIFVPANNASGSGFGSSFDYISPYVAKKRHFAYSCFC